MYLYIYDGDDGELWVPFLVLRMRGEGMMMNKDVLFHHHQQQQQQQVVAEDNMSNLTSASGDQASVSSGNNRTEASGSNFVNPQQQQQLQYFVQQPQAQSSQPPKKKRNQPGNPDPEAEVIALSPKTLLATNRFVCEICNKGFQRDQNLQLHRRGHNLPWKLKQRSKTEVVRKKVYVCPEPSCVHHDPSRALGDLTGIKKHFFRKHGEKKWKCEKCSKRYAVQSDWKAHSKTCGTKEYRCDCGTLFSRRDSFITHRAFCDALAEESAKAVPTHQPNPLMVQSSSSSHNLITTLENYSTDSNPHPFSMKKEHEGSFNHTLTFPPWLSPSNPNPSAGLFPFGPATAASFHHPSPPSPAISATALLQRAAQMGPTKTTPSSLNLATTMAEAMMASPASMFQGYDAMSTNSAAGLEAFDESFGGLLRAEEKNGGGEGLTRDFLGLRPLSHSDILSFAGIGDCFNGNVPEQQQQQNHSQK
ncbi:PREDICTED: protein indeterminate-domain 7-like isoform X2 [Tarenaya hassleriana]|uniref:protein indeterminate-domain 7-like isoform X2 n=1 Tax=Tarenaya hassleriana TaxID=28532 RepID=UPI00053C9915|nr:PREDICTED: protein indeterminate-domain 7-like isoform X2 [Tarenaya hassleriana]